MRRIDENLPLQQKKLLQLIEKKFNGNVSDFSRCIGKSQQVINRLFNIDKRSGKYPTISISIIQSVCDAFGFNSKFFYEEEDAMDLRIKQIMEDFGHDNNKFALTVNIEPTIFDKKTKGMLPWTIEDVDKISKALNIRKSWLLDGTGQIFVAPAEIRNKIAEETPQHSKHEEVILEVYASCIRRLEDERARVIEEVKEIREIKDELSQELKEIKFLKDSLMEAVKTFSTYPVFEDKTHIANEPATRKTL